MEKNKLKIGIVSSSNPNFLGGISLYITNLTNYLNKNNEIYWIYKGGENKRYKKEDINFIEIKTQKTYPLDEFIFNLKVLKILKKEEFDIINSHAQEGFWMSFYKKKKNQRLIHTYHGVTYNFFKNHLKRFSSIKRVLIAPILGYSYLIEKPPWKNADKIICVSRHVKKEFEKLYGKRKNISVIRTGVNLANFRPRNNERIKKELNLSKENNYGLYVGKGGYWTKGLDCVINLSRKIHKLDKKYRLILIGPDQDKIQHLLNEEFIIFLKNTPREKMSDYYNASDLFFCMSRYEGGAPTLVVSEAMASGCLVVISKEANQEIIYNEKNGLIVTGDYKKESKRIIEILGNKKLKNEIIKNSVETINKLSLDKWGKKITEIFIN